MHLRPFHHWESFWLGLFVLSFLGWAQARSHGHHEGIRSFHGDRGVMVGQGPDGVAIYAGVRPSVLGEPLYIWSFPVHERATTRIAPPFRRKGWLHVEIHGQAVPASNLLVAHWFLILLFFVPWAGFLFWRVRRMRRVAEIRTSVEKGAPF